MDVNNINYRWMLVDDFVNAINDTNSQLIHARTSYKIQDIVWDAKFSPIFKDKDKKIIVNIDRIN